MKSNLSEGDITMKFFDTKNEESQIRSKIMTKYPIIWDHLGVHDHVNF